MFFNYFLRSFRILLLPLALLYWIGIAVRNCLYDLGILKSTSFGLPLICVGNLAVGGTGKSPMVEYLVYLLKDRFHVATLSRGYKRKTKGYALADDSTTALDIGDEPMQFHLKFPNVPVAVGEKRIEAVPQLLHDRPGTEAIILDDAFQHRAIKAGLNILLTEHGNLFTRDFYLPTGDLRDMKSQYRRADIIIVTKCDPGMAEKEKKDIIAEISPREGQSVFFTAIDYDAIYHIVHRGVCTQLSNTGVLLVSGIANPRPLQSWLHHHCQTYSVLTYADHHVFTIDDLKEIKRKFDEIKAAGKIILTTEKDAVRLLKFEREINDWPLYVIPVRHGFLFGEEKLFNEKVIAFIRDFKKEST